MPKSIYCLCFFPLQLWYSQIQCFSFYFANCYTYIVVDLLTVDTYFIRLIFWQAVSLISSYLHVPLRYPIQLGGSHSYIIDNAPSKDLAYEESSSSTMPSANTKHVQFPLFLEGQDTTRAAYAVFLLNKVYIS